MGRGLGSGLIYGHVDIPGSGLRSDSLKCLSVLETMIPGLFLNLKNYGQVRIPSTSDSNSVFSSGPTLTHASPQPRALFHLHAVSKPFEHDRRKLPKLRTLQTSAAEKSISQLNHIRTLKSVFSIRADEKSVGFVII